jgi:glycogen phosphorylase
MMEPGTFRPVTESLLEGGDRYMLLADLPDYIRTQEQVDTAYKDRDCWDRKAIMNVARAGRFSSDRTIQEYASQIWHVDPCDVGPM